MPRRSQFPAQHMLRPRSPRLGSHSEISQADSSLRVACPAWTLQLCLGILKGFIPGLQLPLIPIKIRRLSLYLEPGNQRDLKGWEVWWMILMTIAQKIGVRDPGTCHIPLIEICRHLDSLGQGPAGGCRVSLDHALQDSLWAREAQAEEPTWRSFFVSWQAIPFVPHSSLAMWFTTSLLFSRCRKWGSDPLNNLLESFNTELPNLETRVFF